MVLSELYEPTHMRTHFCCRGQMLIRGTASDGTRSCVALTVCDQACMCPGIYVRLCRHNARIVKFIVDFLIPRILLYCYSMESKHARRQLAHTIQYNIYTHIVHANTDTYAFPGFRRQM